MLVTELSDSDKYTDYTTITKPSELTLEEKFDLIFALMEHLKVKVYRAKFDESFTVLAPD